MEELKVDLAHDIVAELRDAVNDGAYASVSDVVRDALNDWRQRRMIETIEIAELRRLAEEGIESGPALEADAVFARLRARFGYPSAA